MKLIYIEWHDEHARQGWHNKGEMEEFSNTESCIVREVGWVYKETEKDLVLFSRQCLWGTGDTQYGLLQKIPKTWIKKRKTIKL